MKKSKWNKNWKVKEGHSVSVHYVGKLTDGTEFDSSYSRGQTLDFKVGTNNNLIAGFNNAVLGMKKGQKKVANLSADQAYGQVNPAARTKAPKTAFPPDFEFKVGEKVFGQSPNGQPMMAKIVEVLDTEVELDLNHPLAGKDLIFEIELVDASRDVTNTE